ncbi:MAG: SIMPL domain-containing protein [Candidatus Marinimicrobia bacterium]|nr:SIMPL domain-containing protein [Candidatus Neomarinimicrobiota bacterium]
MKKTVSVFISVLFFVVALATFAFAGDEKIFSITIIGKGAINAAPDKAEIFVRIIGAGQTQKLAVEMQAKKMKMIMDFFRKKNISSKDVSTLNYLCGPRYEYDRSKQKNVFVEYIASQRLKIPIPKDVIGEIIDGASIWAVVENITFVVSNKEEVLEKATLIAIEDAQSKAKKRADALGIKLGAVLNYHENSSPNPPLYGRDELTSSVRGGNAVQIPVGETEISVTVSITYEIIVLRKN